MLERTCRILVEQLVLFLSPSTSKASNDKNEPKSTLHSLQPKACAKLRKVFKALRMMEVHKLADPLFSHSLRPLHPFLETGQKGSIESDTEKQIAISDKL